MLCISLLWRNEKPLTKQKMIYISRDDFSFRIMSKGVHYDLKMNGYSFIPPSIALSLCVCVWMNEYVYTSIYVPTNWANRMAKPPFFFSGWFISCMVWQSNHHLGMKLMHIMDFVALFMMNNRGIFVVSMPHCAPKTKIKTHRENYEVNVRLIDDIDCVGATHHISTMLRYRK